MKFIAERRDDPTGRSVILGADPEFILRRRRSGRIVAANRYFPYRGSVGHDRLYARFLRGRPLAELRPAPASEPEELFPAYPPGHSQSDGQNGKPGRVHGGQSALCALSHRRAHPL